MSTSKIPLCAAGLALIASLTGCLDRPLAPATPTTTNLYVHVVPNHVVDKVDLLFMIDNSMSMVDKQQILARAVPVLVSRLVTPNCVDDDGRATGAVSDAQGHCAQGRPEFRAVKDLHLGIVTSSLGSRGGDTCSPAPDDVAAGITPDDRAELLPTANPAVRGALRSWNGSGFLAWDPGQDRNDPPGEANLANLIGDFKAQLNATGELGCGFEGSLEAWYRFLVDPEPPTGVTRELNAQGTAYVTRRGPVNEALLAQRRAFLRPDSLLAIVMLTDEDDCSIADDDGAQGWLVSSHARMPRASAACTNPDDPCCHTCAAPAPAGCPANDDDASCKQHGASEAYASLGLGEDQPNVRCFDQRRRFGMDLLHPALRYVDALRRHTVRNRAGMEIQNPIFAAPSGVPARSDELVLLAGIVGVPWQDIATSASLGGDELEYLPAAELEAQGRWDWLLGAGSSQPLDPLMRESTEPRAGVHPLLGIPLAPATSTNPSENPINGHEQSGAGADDLQYACTFPLPEPRPCTPENGDSCDCNADEQDKNRPLCTYANGPGTDGVQIAAKAYPGRRELEVLRGIGKNAIVASICPKHTRAAAGLMPEADPSYGYNPAVAALLELMKQRFPNQCLPRPLPVEQEPASPEFGQVPCAVVEAVPKTAGTCACDTSKGRSDLGAGDAKLRPAVTQELALAGYCAGLTGVRCDDFCLCQLEQLAGDGLRACQSGSQDPNLYGYCYVDPDQGIGDPALVDSCESSQRRLLRFVGDGLPKNGAVTFMACVGATVDDAVSRSAP